jgi:hypothetical protein
LRHQLHVALVGNLALGRAPIPATNSCSKHSQSGFYAKRAKPIILTGKAAVDLALPKRFQADSW